MANFNKGAINKKWLVTIIIMIVNLSLAVAILVANFNNPTENQKGDVWISGIFITRSKPERGYVTLPYEVDVTNTGDDYISGLVLSGWVLRDGVEFGRATDQQLGTLKPGTEIEDIEMDITIYYVAALESSYSTVFQLRLGDKIIDEHSGGL